MRGKSARWVLFSGAPVCVDVFGSSATYKRLAQACGFRLLGPRGLCREAKVDAWGGPGSVRR